MFLRAVRCEKHCHHRHTLIPDKVLQGAGGFFKKLLLPLGEPSENANLPAGRIFDGCTRQKCFKVTFGKSNKTENG